jgi:hypothetical protein
VDWYAGFATDGKDESAVVETLKALCRRGEKVTPDVVATWTQPAESKKKIHSVKSESAETEHDIEPARQWQPFPLETLPCQLRHFVIEVSRSIGIDSANTAACVLSILSGIIGRTFRIKIKNGYTVTKIHTLQSYSRMSRSIYFSSISCDKKSTAP